MDKFDSKTADRLREGHAFVARSVERGHSSPLRCACVGCDFSGSGPSTEQSRAFSRAMVVEQRAMAEYIESLGRVSDLALRRSRCDPSRTCLQRCIFAAQAPDRR